MSNIELSDIPSELVKSVVVETIGTLTKLHNDEIKTTITSKVVSKTAAGDVYRIFFKRKDEESSSSSSLILKVSAQNLARRTITLSRLSFMHEIFIYDEVLPYFRKFEQSKGVNFDKDGFNEYPKCYRTVNEDQHECLLIEDLDIRGFTVLDHVSQEMTVDHVRLFLQVLAKFHAVSMAVKDQQPEKFKQLTLDLNEIFMNKDSLVMEAYYAAQLESIFETVSAVEDVHLLAKLKSLFAKGALTIAVETIEQELNEAATVISHGDAHQGNTLFRYDAKGNPVKICFIDWQGSRQASPVIDFIYYVFCCTTKSMRDIHYENLLKIYHDHLSAHIRRLGSDPEKLFPYTMMLEHLRKFARLGLIRAPLIVPIFCADAGNQFSLNWDELTEDFMRNQEVPNLYKRSDASNAKFKERMRDIIIDMNRLEYI